MSDTDWLSGKSVPIPENEDERLQALSRYESITEPPHREKVFDRLASLAAEICGTPIAFINLIGEDKEFKKACFGFNGSTTPRRLSFCQFTIMQDGIYEIPDTHKSDIFKTNPNVTGKLNLRYYVGIPLTSPEGYNIGTLCLIDRKPNKLDESERRAIKILADEIISQFELNAARRKLEKNNLEKDELIRIISHDMRSPLTGIIGFSELLKDEVKNAEHRQLLEHIEDAGKALNSIINELLNSKFVKNETFKINRKEVNVADLSREVVTMHTPSAKLKRQRISVNIPETLSFSVDPKMWKKIVGNLLSNAMKFTYEGGSISVSPSKEEIKENGPLLILKVKDTGIGISEEDQKNLFSTNNRILKTGTEGEKSSGIGIPTIKKYVDLHEGRINVSSTLHEGTEITVQIPS